LNEKKIISINFTICFSPNLDQNIGLIFLNLPKRKRRNMEKGRGGTKEIGKEGGKA
jgi:hypothetical protein